MLALLPALALATAPPAPSVPTALPTSAHAEQDALFGPGARRAPLPARGQLPPPTPGPDLKVYGYLAYWADDLATVPWDDLTHLAMFSAGVNSDGTLYDTWKWDQTAAAKAMGAPYGVKVHLCVTNFSGSSIDALLSSTTSRTTLKNALVEWVALTGADGVNIDFEGTYGSNKQDLVDFTAELDAAIDEVVLATPAVDWNGAWDYSELSKYADLFIMGYGYHWGGSGEAGPVDPLYSGSGTAWTSPYSLAWTIDDYLYYGSVAERTILGLPLYGYWWDTAGSSYPTSALGSGDAIFFYDAWPDAATYGRLYDPTSVTPYYYDGAGQGWYGDTDTVRERVRYAADAGIGGVGFWALNYVTDPAFWEMVGDEAGVGLTTSPGDTGATADTGGATGGGGGGGGGSTDAYVADAGLPFLAYVGDTVILSGSGSTGPGPLQYRWTQLSGTPVALSATDAEPSFTVAAPGHLSFELRVGDGTVWSDPARSDVVVLDPGAGERYATSGCACDAAGSGPTALAPLAAAWLLRRRRRAV